MTRLDIGHSSALWVTAPSLKSVASEPASAVLFQKSLPNNSHPIRKPTRELVIAEVALDAESTRTLITHNPAHRSQTLDSNLPAAAVRGRHQYLNPDLASDRGASAAENQCPVQRDVAGEAAFGLLASVGPVEDHGKAELIAG